MKKLFVLFFGLCLSLFAYCSNVQGEDMSTLNKSSNIQTTPVVLTIGEKKIKAVIYDNKTGQDVLSKLPYTITLHRYEMDYCGTLNSPLAFDENEKHNGWKNGDIDLAGSYFSILFAGEEKSQDYKDMITFGRIEDDLSIVKELGSSITLIITRAE